MILFHDAAEVTDGVLRKVSWEHTFPLLFKLFFLNLEINTFIKVWEFFFMANDGVIILEC